MGEQAEPISDIGTQDLGGRTVRGGAIVFGAMAVQKVLALVVMAVLARLLTPHEFGLVGMVFALTVFLQLFADLGLTMATVQKAEITQAQISTVFWVNLAFSGLLSLVAASLAPAIAWFYHQPALLSVTLWLAPGFLAAGLGTQHAALMQRRMQFGRLAVCDTAGLVAGGVTGIWMALGGWGVYALVGQSLAQVGIRSVGLWLVAGWLPGLPVRRSGVREMLRFGGFLAGFNILNYFSRNLDKVLLGRFWGAAPLGLYTRAYALMMYPIGLVSAPMGRVMTPALSRLQKDAERLRDAYRRGLFVIALLSFPMMAGLLATADEIVPIVFGARWSGAIPIFRALCLAGFWQGIYNATGQLYVAAGRTDRMFRAGAVASTVLVVAFSVGAIYGPVGVAAVYAVGFSLLLPWYLWYTYSTVGLKLSLAMRGIIRGPLIAAAVLVPVAWYAGCLSPAGWPTFVVLAVKVAAGGVAYAAALTVLCQVIETFRWMLRHIRSQSGEIPAGESE